VLVSDEGGEAAATKATRCSKKEHSHLIGVNGFIDTVLLTIAEFTLLEGEMADYMYAGNCLMRKAKVRRGFANAERRVNTGTLRLDAEILKFSILLLG